MSLEKENADHESTSIPGANILAAIATQFSGGVVVTDLDGRLEWANQGFLDLTGYALTELIGRKPGALLQGPGSDPVVIKQISQHVRQKLPFETEILNYRKDGSAYTLYLKIDPIRNAKGEITHFVGFQTDVSARRRELNLVHSILQSAQHGIITT
ncbi:MAG: PAS domain-containing protein, partial [Leptospiraceae bacterium]|nr:PAS domain-containing protein [Leptospiraceae bacterium]